MFHLCASFSLRLDESMRYAWLAILLAFSAVPVCGQEPVPHETQAEDVEQRPWDLQFSLPPVEVDFSEELTEAKRCYQAGQWQPAVKAATAFLTQYPEHRRRTTGLFLRAEANLQLEKWALAEADFQRVLESDPHEAVQARTEFRLGEVAMLVDNWELAKQRLASFCQTRPDDPLNAYAIVYLAEATGHQRPAQAKELYLEALRKYPAGPLADRARLHLGVLRFGEGKYEFARRDLAKWVRDADEQSDEYWLAYYWLGRSELMVGQADAGCQRLLEFARQQPEHELTAGSLYLAAEVYRESGERNLALDCYQQCRDEWPDSNYLAAAKLGVLQSLKGLGRLDEALAEFETSASTLPPEMALPAHQLAAEILISRQQYAQAEALIKPFYLPHPALENERQRNGHYTNLYLLALCHRGRGKHALASELLGRIRQDLASRELAHRVALARVENWVASQEFQLALQAADEFVRRYPNSKLLSAVRAQAVWCHFELGQLPQVEASLQQLQAQGATDPFVIRATEQVAEAAYERGYDPLCRLAFRWLTTLKQPSDTVARAWSGLAWLEKNRGNHAAAAKQFANFLALFPNHDGVEEVRLALADSLQKLGRTREAISALQPFLEVSQQHALRPQGLFQLADLAQSQRQHWPIAFQALQALIADYPEYQQLDGVLYLSATLKLRAGVAGAEEQFNEIVADYPASPYWSDALYRLAELANNRQETQQAEEYLTRLISTDRGAEVMPYALFLRGRMESHAQDWTTARDTLREIIRDYPESSLLPVAKYGIAESFFQEKDFDRSYDLFQLLDQTQPFQPRDSWAAMVKLRLAQLHVQRREFAQAVTLARAIEPNYPGFSLQHEADYLLGRVSAADGKFAQARQAYHKVVSADPTYQREITAMAQWMLGETYLHQQQYVLAIKAYEALLADIPFDNWKSASHVQVGRCYESLGNESLARKSYLRVIKQYPETTWAAEAQRRLDSLSPVE